MEQSRRQRLLEYMETGRLRDDVSGTLDSDAVDLLIDIVARYCADRPRKRHTPRAAEGRAT